MGQALDRLLSCAQGLVRAQLLPPSSQVDGSHTAALLARLVAAGARAGPEGWHVCDLVERCACVCACLCMRVRV